MTHYIPTSPAPGEKALRRMGLPGGLVRWLKAGTLAREVDAAFRQLDALNALLDDWEVRNPDAAMATPWHQGREAWKAAGRPRPHWIEALQWRETSNGRSSVPLKIGEVEKDLLLLHMKPYLARRKARG